MTSRRPAASAGALTLGLLAASSLWPQPAFAFSVQDEVKKAVGSLFGTELDSVRGSALQWFVKVPNYIEDPGKLTDLGTKTTGIAGALLAATATLAVIHYWAAGVSLSGSGSPVEAIPKTVGAALFIVAWPWTFSQGVALTNSVTAAIIDGGSFDKLANIFTIGSLTGVGIIIAIPISLGVVIVMIMLTLTKLGLTATVALIYVGTPLAVCLYPVQSLAWIPQFVLKLYVAILAIFITWALEFATMAALFEDVLSWSGGGAWMDKLAKPLVGLAMLMVMLSTSKQWLRQAGVLAGGGGAIGNTLAWAAGHLAFNAVSRQIPDALGGRRDTVAATAQREATSNERYQDGQRRNQANDQRQGARDAEGQRRYQEQQTRNAANDQRQATRDQRQQTMDAERVARQQAVATERAQRWNHDNVLVTDPSGVPRAAPEIKGGPVGAELRAFEERHSRGMADIGGALNAYNDLPAGHQARVYDLVSGASSAPDAGVSRGIAEMSAAPSLDPGVRENLRVVGAASHGVELDTALAGQPAPSVPPSGGQQPVPSQPSTSSAPPSSNGGPPPSAPPAAAAPTPPPTP